MAYGEKFAGYCVWVKCVQHLDQDLHRTRHHTTTLDTFIRMPLHLTPLRAYSLVYSIPVSFKSVGTDTTVHCRPTYEILTLH